MVIKSESMQTELRENMRGGQGAVNLLGIVPQESLPAKARLFSQLTLEPGCSIGAHTHEGETEIYYVLEGEGLLDDNGAQVALRAGDCNVCLSGAFHAIANQTDKPLKILAAIILD